MLAPPTWTSANAELTLWRLILGVSVRLRLLTSSSPTTMVRDAERLYTSSRNLVSAVYQQATRRGTWQHGDVTYQ